MKTKRVFTFTAIFLLLFVTCMEPKCSSVSKDEAIKIVNALRAQAKWAEQQQLKRFHETLTPFLAQKAASSNMEVFAKLISEFGRPDNMLYRKFDTGYIIQQHTIGFIDGEPLHVVVYLVYWKKSEVETERPDGFTGRMKLATKYDLLLLQFINDTKLVSYLAQCKR